MGFNKYLHLYKYHHNQNIEHSIILPNFFISTAAVWHKKEVLKVPIFKRFHFKSLIFPFLGKQR